MNLIIHTILFHRTNDLAVTKGNVMDAMLKYNDLEGKRITLKNIKYKDIGSKVSVEGRIIEVNIYIYIKIRCNTISFYIHLYMIF